MMSIVIKPAQIKDVETIFSLINKLAEYEKLTHEVVGSTESLKEHLFGEKSFAKVLIAFFDDKPAGFALFFNNYSTFLTKPGIYLEDLFVLPELRGKGIGKKLFNELRIIAKENNFGRIEWSVLNWNTPAIDFYKSLGAKPQDKWTVYRLTENNF